MQKIYCPDDIKQLEEVHINEKKCLIRLINTYGMIIESFDEYAPRVNSIKALLEDENVLPEKPIEKEVVKLRRLIFEKEMSGNQGLATTDSAIVEIENLLNRIAETNRLLRRVVYFFLEDFYPLEADLKETADSIRIDVEPDVPADHLARQVETFSRFSVALKQKIFFDFVSINETFQFLLKQVYTLESLIEAEFNARDKVKAFDAFEENLGREMGAITRAFEVKKNIDELRNAVMSKLGNIKKIVDQKKQAEMNQLEKANRTIQKLKKKVVAVQTKAREISARASRFEKDALYDSLTDVHNRKAFELRINDVVSRMEAGGADKISLILFDVNHFKWINDSFGHVAGDKVLKAIAEQLKKNFRKTDFVARYGGDEFVVLVEGLGVETVQERIERFKKRLKTIKFVSHAQKTNIKVEVSAGLAMAEKGDSGTSLIHRADQAMYEDKKNAVSPPDTVTGTKAPQN